MKTIDIQNNICINSDAKTVFEFVSAYENDKYWRKIVYETKVDITPIKIGTRLVEQSFLSRKYPNYTTVFNCVDLQANSSISFETSADNLFWSKNTRSVEVINETSCIFKYHFILDAAIVNYALGFSLPFFMIKLSTQLEMKRYLNAVKYLLEKE